MTFSTSLLFFKNALIIYSWVKGRCNKVGCTSDS